MDRVDGRDGRVDMGDDAGSSRMMVNQNPKGHFSETHGLWHGALVTGRARGARTVVGKKTAPDDRDPTD